MATRTEEGRKKWSEGLQGDLKEIVEHLEKAFKLMRDVEPHAQGVNGLASFLRGQGNAVEQMAKAFQLEVDEVPAKIAGEKTRKRAHPMAERTASPEHLASVAEAREAAEP